MLKQMLEGGIRKEASNQQTSEVENTLRVAADRGVNFV